MTLRRAEKAPDSIASHSSRLDTQESSAHSTPIEQPDSSLAFPLDCEAFVHSGCKPMRIAVVRAYQRLMIREEKFWRYMSCGTEARVEQNADDPARFRLRCFRCNDRWCPSCQHRRRRWLLARVLPRLPQKNLRLVTLTQRANELPLRVQVENLQQAFKRLRRSTLWRRTQLGGYQFLEITFNQQTGRWHPHLHCLVEGHYVHKRELVDQWKIASKGSFILDIQFLFKPQLATRYVTKYVTKPIPAAVYRVESRLDEAILSLKGIRFYQPFGSWYRIDRKEEEDFTNDWIDVGSYNDLRSRAVNGDPEAEVILLILKGKLYFQQNDPTELDNELETGVLPGNY